MDGTLVERLTFLKKKFRLFALLIFYSWAWFLP